MTAYIIAEVDVTDAEAYKAYAAAVPATIAQYGGRFLVRGGTADVLEGEWPQRRRVILEFPSMDAARAWWDSPEYEKARAMRRAASNGRLILLEGYAA